MRTNVLEKARERGLEIEGKINNHFDELIRKEKRKIIGKSNRQQGSSRDEGSKRRPTRKGK
jgi:hypothetical protein